MTICQIRCVHFYRLINSLNPTIKAASRVFRQLLSKHLGLEYCYVEDAADPPAAQTTAFDAARLSALPDALRDRLREAVLRLDMVETVQTAHAIAEIDAELGAWLAAEAHEIRFEHLLELCEQAVMDAHQGKI